VDGHRVGGLDRAEPRGADLDDLVRALERRAEAIRAAADHDAGVAVVEPQLVVVLGDEQRAPGVPRLARR
jgi:hypothetical protein